MNDWIDEVVETEPEIPMDELNQKTEEYFADKFEGVDEAWRNIVDRGYSQGSFRLPKGEEDELNCLGRALLTSMYGALSGEAEDISLNIYFDDKFAEDGTRKMQQPHVTTVIDSTEYGGEGAGDPENVPVSALPDLYKVGLGVEMLNNQEEIEELDYSQLKTWGREIHEGYRESTSEPDSEYLSTQGYLMREEADEEIARECLEGEDADVFIA